MAERDVTVRWSPSDGTLEIIGAPIGPAGVAVLVRGAVHLAWDLADDTALARVVIDRDEEADLDQQVILDLLDDAGMPIGGGPEAGEWAVALPDEVTLGLSRVGALAVVDDILRADRLTPVARLAATCEAAALGLGAGGTLGTTWHTAVERLWSIVGDPEADEVVAHASPIAREVLVELLERCRRTDVPHLDDALGELLARWRTPPPPELDPTDADPLTRRESAAAAPPPPAAPVPAAGGAERPMVRSALTDAVDEAIAGPLVERVGDEARVVVPPTAPATGWVRVALREHRVLLAAAPVAAARDGAVRLPLDAGVPTDALLVDVVADPAAPVRDRPGEALAEAVEAGRAAVAAERQGRLGAATAAWHRCAASWTEAGDASRAAQAIARADAPHLGEPLAHERLAM